MNPLFSAAWTLAALLTTGAALAQPQDQPSLRLYTMDCGRIELDDMAWFADTGEYDGKPGRMIVPCYLIRHAQGDLIWDAGLGDAHAAEPNGFRPFPPILQKVTVTLAEQLRQIGLSYDAIGYFAFSHAHADHVGNANALKRATWIINRAELAAITQMPPAAGIDPALLSARSQVKTVVIDGDHDIFGDGRAVILRAPGHTPGHQVLKLKLAKAGTVILGGDLWHTLDNRRKQRVPGINTSRADTLASFDRIERIARNSHARVIVEHAGEDFRTLPRFPHYLD